MIVTMQSRSAPTNAELLDIWPAMEVLGTLQPGQHLPAVLSGAGSGWG